jgi:LPS export ABC transporter protein LptC
VTYQILAERLDELPDEERLRLAGVSVRYRPVDETAWDIAAASATAPKDGSELELVGNVALTSSPADGSKPISIATAKLRFSPDTSSADSDEPVHLRFGDLELDGGCLRAQLKDEALRLECGVHGTFRQ